MRKLNLNDVQEAKDFKSPKAGGYVCGIMKVEDVPEKEYLKVYYDIIEGEFKGYYTNLKKEVERVKDLPFFFASYKDSALRFFKGTITAVEKSNKGFVWKDDEKDLVKKKIGLVLFEEEYVKSDGSVGVSLRVDKAHSVEAIKSDDFEVPERKCVAQSATTTQSDPFASTTKPADDFFGDAETPTDDYPTFGNDSVAETDDEPFPFDLD